MYKIEAVDQITGRRRLLADWFPNLITTNGGNLLGSSTSCLLGCYVGAGNSTPALTDTSLNSLVGTYTGKVSGSTSVSSSTPWYGSTTIQYSFAAGSATGNLSEVGVGATATSLFSRALILDGGGSPTTITVLSSEALYVTYQLNQYSPTTDATGNVTIAGVSYAYVIRAANANSAQYWAYATTGDLAGLYSASVSAGAIGSVTGNISGTTYGASGISNAGYSSGSFAQACTATWSITSGNTGSGVSAAAFYFGPNYTSRGLFQMSFSPSIPKDSSHTLALSVTNSWAINAT